MLLVILGGKKGNPLLCVFIMSTLFSCVVLQMKRRLGQLEPGQSIAFDDQVSFSGQLW